MRPFVTITVVLVVLAVMPGEALRVETLRSIGGLPPHIAGAFHEPVGFQQGPDGTYYVFDRRAHAVFAIDAARSAVRTLVTIGQEEGRLIQPRGFDVASDGRIVVADAPRNRHRIQVFDPAGVRQAGFYLQGQPASQVVWTTCSSTARARYISAAVACCSAILKAACSSRPTRRPAIRR